MTRHRLHAAPARSAAGDPDSPSEALPRDDARVAVFTVAGFVVLTRDGNGEEAWPCTVRDVSRGGARLELDRAEPPRLATQLPDAIVLYICPERSEVHARVAWRDGRHFGVQFLGEMTPSKRRLD